MNVRFIGKDDTRRDLRQRLVDAALAVFHHQKSSSLVLRIPNTTPVVYIVAGEKQDSIKGLAR